MNFFLKFSKRPKIFIVLSAILLVFAVYTVSFMWKGKKVDFNAEVRPIINNKCIACHGGVKKSGGFSLLFREEALGKTKSGNPAIIPGHPGKSEFMRRLRSTDPEQRMPLEKDPLTEEEIAILERWIRQGAEWEDHWSFIKPEKTTPPEIEDKAFVKNDVDKFVLLKLEEKGLKHSPEADKATLIRRVSLDLTGLPPTEEEVNNFVNDRSANAYEKVVDRLLASTAYGERWTAMWLDMARYADSKGYEKDLHRNIWRYRDYVIKAFNEDKPYDKFTIEQLAGDLLPNPGEEQIIATAFHRNTMNNDEGGTDNEEFRTAELIDRINTTFDVWQGITIGCVQCHSHPYDPIRHKEYFNFMAFLNNTSDGDMADDSPVFVSKEEYDEKKAEEIIKQLKNITGDKTEIPVGLKDKRSKYLKSRIPVIDFAESFKVEIHKPSITLLQHNSYLSFNDVDLTDIKSISCQFISDKGGNIEVRLDKADGKKLGDIELISTFNEFYGAKRLKLKKPVNGKHKVFFILRPNDKGVGDAQLLKVQFFTAEIKNKAKRKIVDSLTTELGKVISPVGTPVMEELNGAQRRTTQVFNRGSWIDKGEKVEAAVPKTLNPMPHGAPKNRLGMAQWLVSKENPLTARVAVNRFWEQLFGYGIVETLEDFGSQGNKPTHPELLDWLAVTFMDDCGWSMKKILKVMVLSGTYRQSSIAHPEHLEKDPKNQYFARGPRVRLTAEQIRDQALAVSGLLSKKMNGPSVMPHQPEKVWQTVYNGMEWKLSEGEDQFRRAVYTYLKRTSPYPNMLNFDGPSREFCMVRRIRSNTPLQALATLNDTVSTIVSLAMAKKMMEEGGNDVTTCIKRGYRMALFHDPDANALNKLVAFYTKMDNYYQKNKDKAVLFTGSKETGVKLAPLALVAGVIINQDEFLTKE